MLQVGHMFVHVLSSNTLWGQKNCTIIFLQ